MRRRVQHGALSLDFAHSCDGGTINNTVSIITTRDMKVQSTSTIDVGLIPYWASTSAGGNAFFISLSGDNAVAVVDYATGRSIAHVAIGKFPQRNRLGKVPRSAIALLSKSGG